MQQISRRICRHSVEEDENENYPRWLDCNAANWRFAHSSAKVLSECGTGCHIETGVVKYDSFVQTGLVVVDVQ